MSANLAALVFALTGVGLALVLLPVRAVSLPLLPAYAAWVLLTAIFFFVGDFATVLFSGLAVFAALAAILAATGERTFGSTDVARSAAFLFLMPCIPFYVHFMVPFPGINYLFDMTHYKVVVLTLLLPVAIFGGTQTRGSWDIAAVLFAGYAVYTAVMTAEHLNVTSGLRYFVDQVLLIVVPYLVLSRALRQPRDFEFSLSALLAVSLVLAGVALCATWKQWDFYGMFEELTALTLPDFRSGFLRIEATANTHSLGFHLAVGLLALEALKTQLGLGAARCWLIRVLLVSAMLFTGSRGALLATVVAYFVFFATLQRSSVLRWSFLFALGGGSILGAVWLLSPDVARVDQYGTFSYRQELLRTSIAFIADYPIFGDLNWLASGRFGHLVQGQHIVDVTNLYLYIGLRFGLLGVALFCAPFFIVAYRLWLCRIDASDALAPARAAVLGGLIGWLMLVITTSDVALTLHLGILLAAFGGALVASLRRPVAEPIESRSWEGPAIARP